MKKLYLSLLVVISLTAYAEEPADTVASPIEDSFTLDDFVVTARKKLIKADAEKVSYEAAEDPDSQSLTVLDMVKRVPMVTVDGQDNITINGKSDFQVYVNGRPNPLLSSSPGQLLKSMPAGSIQRIEVINNPGATYDAEGVGGILNIVFKTAGNLNGYTATISATAGTQMQNGSLYALVQQDKVGVTANISAVRYDPSRITYESNRLDINDGSVLKNISSMNNQFNSFNASLNVDWKPNTSNIFAFSGSFQRTPMRMYNNGTVSMMDASGLTLLDYSLSSRTKNRIMGITAGADYTHIFGGNDAHKLQLAYRLNVTPVRTMADNYFTTTDELAADLIPQNYSTSDRTSMTENIGQADYSLPVGEKHSFGVGSKLTFRRSASDAGGLDYVHHSTITAAYLTYGLKAGDFSLNAGARYEHTHQSAKYKSGLQQPYSADYNNFVPSLTMSQVIHGVNTLSVGYNMRISRPGINMLNPYVNNTNPLQIQTGNPNLHPEKYNNINLNWSAFWGKVIFNAQGGYSFSTDGITQITEMRDGITYSSYYNTLHSRQGTLSLFMTYNPWAKTRIMVSSSTSYSALKSHKESLSSYGWTESYMAGVQQTLPWELQLSVNLFGQTGQRALQMKTGSMFTHMLSLSRAFLSDRLNISLTAMSPFCGSNKIKIHEWGAGMDNHSSIKLNLRSVTLSVSYRLGDLKASGSKQRKLDSDLVNPSSQSGNGMPSNIPGTGM